jgi:hypothetical protein
MSGKNWQVILAKLGGMIADAVKFSPKAIRLPSICGQSAIFLLAVIRAVGQLWAQ